MLGNQTITKDELKTVLPEIEYVVNTKPLTTVTDAPTDIRPLTPADFVLNRENLDFSTPKSTQKSLVTGTATEVLEVLEQFISKRASKDRSQI